MKPWNEIIVEWLNCLDILDANIKDLKQLDDGQFYRKLIERFSWDGAKNTSETENIVIKFLQDEYPEYKFDHEDLVEMEHVYIASLFLLHVSQEPLFYRPMCVKLQHETQLKIKTFLEMIIPHGKNVNRQMLYEIITELENDTPNTPNNPVTPKTKTLKDFFNSPASRSAQNYKLLSQRCRELRTLKTELEVERFEKADLQEDLRIQQNKVQNLLKKLQEKTAEIKAVREAKMNSNTPQSCKKNKDTKEYERYYKKEIDRLEDQLMQKQCEIDKLEVDNETLNKKLTCMGKQCIYFKEKVENSERTLQHMQMQGEVKDRELVNLRITNEELRTHLKELSKTGIEEQSFEIDGIAPFNSPSSPFNNSEALSSVIDIQLQDAKAESAMIKIQLDVSNKKLESLSQEYEKTTELLKERTKKLQNTEAQLTETLNKYNNEIGILEKEKESILIQNKDLKMLCSSQKESLLHAKESENVLNTEINTMKEKVKNLQKSVDNEKSNTAKLNTELVEIKSQVCEKIKCMEDVTEQNNSYKNSIDLWNKKLKEIIHNSGATDIDINNLDNKTTTQLIEHVQIALCNFNTKYSLREVELKSLETAMEKAKLELENFKSQISQLQQTDEQNIIKISKLKETLTQDAKNIKQYSEEISYLKEIELEKEILEKDLTRYKEEMSKNDSLLQTSRICLQSLKQKMLLLKDDYCSVKKDVLNQMNEYQKHNNENNKNILHTHKILFTNYTKEQHCRNQLENELADSTKKLIDVKNLNSTLENDLVMNRKMVSNLQLELTNNRKELTEYVRKLEKLEETKEKYKTQYQCLVSENQNILCNLNEVNNKFENTQKEICNMANQLKFKDERIETLIAEISSLKLEKEHIIHLKMGGETEMKNFVKVLETKLLEKQRQLDQLSIEVKLKQETLELVQGKLEELSKDTITSEMKLKEVIMNLQEVRTNQDAVLKAQEKALDEKCSQLEQLEKEFRESKRTVCKQLEEQKLVSQNLQTTNSELQLQLYKQTETIKGMQEMLKEETNKLNKNEEYCKAEKRRKLEITQICEKLECSVNDLKSTIVETSPKDENIYTDIICDVPCLNNDDKVGNILKIVQASIKEIHASRKLILHLSNVNANLMEAAKNQKVIVDNYVAKCEEVKLLKTKIQELNNIEEKSIEDVKMLIKHKESFKNFLHDIMKSREDLDTSLHELQEKWNKLLTGSSDIFIMDKSVCDELKNIQVKKMHIENTLTEYHTCHFRNIKPLQNILWVNFLWSEQILKNTILNATERGRTVHTSPDAFSDDKILIELELNKNAILQQDIAKFKNEVEDFSDLVTSFENNIRTNKVQLQSESEKKLQSQIDELTKSKNNVETKLNCAEIKNAKLEEDIVKLKTKMQDLKTTSLKEIVGLKEELIQLKEQKVKMQEETNELSKRPKKEDVDKQLKDIHDKYTVKLNEIKLNMKTAYNEQITKLNKEQEQCIQERLESLQKRMELQCRKQAEELSKYKTHVAGMSSQIWNVGEKLLSERQEKEKLQKELTELKARCQNFDQKIISSVKHKSSKLEKKDLLKESKEEVLHKVAVIQEKTTYERRCSIRSIQTMGNAFNAEDEEGEVFDNIYLADMKDGNASCNTDSDRLTILKKRNALCKPHLKSSYPAETQFHPVPFTEEEIKAGSTADEIFNDSLSQSLLPEQKAKKKDRTQTSYKKPGPPTPSKNGGRLSLQGNELKSPNSRILKERNKDRATTTPRTLKNLFISRRQDENVTVTPRSRSRRSSMFRKHRNANDR